MGHPDTSGGVSETVIQREICDWLHSMGYFFWRSNNVPTLGRSGFVTRTLPKYTPRGLPDIMMVRGGTFIGFEVKRPSIDGVREKNGRALRKGMLSPEQAEWGIRLEDNGGKYYCVRSLDEVKAILRTP